MPLPPGMLDGMQRELEETHAQFKKVSEATGVMGKVQQALDSLVKMGTAVSEDDVIETAAKLVGDGLGAQQVTAMLSGMPPGEGGEALASWLQEKDEELREKSQMLGELHESTRHRLGVEGLRTLMAHAVHGQGPITPVTPQSEVNSLSMPQGGGE